MGTAFEQAKIVGASDTEFLEAFHETTKFGATANGGIDRQAGTPEHGEVRKWFREKADEFGLTVSIDSIGNQYARYEFFEDAPYIYLGSHLDSQPLGGRFDGTYGVVAGLYAAARLIKLFRDEDEKKKIQFNICVVDWFNEEGARFAPSIMGSSVMVGQMDLEDMLNVQDVEGTSVREALKAIGCLGSDSAPEVAAYAEIHIEQGRILEREKVVIGAVDRSWHTQKLLVKVTGEQSHTGATIMSDRHDALTGAAEIILYTEKVVENFNAEKIVTSVGQCNILPNSPIVVPREVNLVIDLRAEEKTDVEEARRLIKDQISECEKKRGLRIEVGDFDIRSEQRYPEEGIEVTEKAAADEGIPFMRMRTMAGHDSVALNHIVPSVMIFVPSVGGVSHCEREFTEDEDLVKGLAVLTSVARRMIEGELDGIAPGEPT